MRMTKSYSRFNAHQFKKKTPIFFSQKTFRGGHRESPSCPVVQWPQSIRQCKPTQFLSRGDKLAQMLGIGITQRKSLLINDAKQTQVYDTLHGRNAQVFHLPLLTPTSHPSPSLPAICGSLPQRQRAPRNLLTHQMPKWDPDSYKSTLAASILQANPCHSLTVFWRQVFVWDNFERRESVFDTRAGVSSPIYHEVACFQAPVLAFSFNMAKTIVSNFGASHPKKNKNTDWWQSKSFPYLGWIDFFRNRSHTKTPIFPWQGPKPPKAPKPRSTKSSATRNRERHKGWLPRESTA